MEVKRGYKQTEVGVIPEDWATPELGDILKSMQLGGNYKNSERETNWPLIKMGNLGRGKINIDKLEYVEISLPPASRDRLEEDDVLFNTRNTLELVGKVAIWRNELPEAYFNSNIMRMWFNEERVSSRRFMNYILNTSRSLRSLRSIAIGTTSVAAIYSRDLVKIRIPLPTKAEQEAIAEALSDADALIESLEQLVAKKRNVKQGAMQELLTGKKRLPGFSGEWEVKTFAQVAPLQRGFDLPSGNLQRGPFPVVYSNGVLTHHSVFQVKGPGVVTGRSGTIGNVNFVEQDFWPHNTTLWVTSFKGNDPKYVFYLYTRVGLERFATGSGVPTLNRNDVHAYKVSIPATIDEQTAIAAILSDMDAELAALETKLAKARQVKQGMMQELLTGRIRLV